MAKRCALTRKGFLLIVYIDFTRAASTSSSCFRFGAGSQQKNKTTTSVRNTQLCAPQTGFCTALSATTRRKTCNSDADRKLIMGYVAPNSASRPITVLTLMEECLESCAYQMMKTLAWPSTIFENKFPGKTWTSIAVLCNTKMGLH